MTTMRMMRIRPRPIQSTARRYGAPALPQVLYRLNGLSGLGDDPATISQIIDAGMDPTDPNVKYTVDANGNVTQNITVQASPLPPQKPIWPLVAVLGLVGYALFEGGKRSAH